jgi:hypothetical protein
MLNAVFTSFMAATLLIAADTSRRARRSAIPLRAWGWLHPLLCPGRSKLWRAFGRYLSGHESFVRLFGNLYIVPVPLNGAAEKSIEELFAPADVAKGKDGKTFDFSKDGSDATSIGKAGFAHDFVAKQAEDLDWSGFHPLLQNICAALNDYDAASAVL